MNSRWQANKIGLVNFWYYDEQEFSFAKGRMLLRGANGSGKSVTMQSVVPLLLDGNMSPERLDPFGSRDRKMNSYLLEEDDDREERTGYLYLEFKRMESNEYITVGMGIRARKGKQLDKWYFSISDGRRVGEDFLLYKSVGEKITLSKRELENRIGIGGSVFEKQSDYMEYVNRQIFGFETKEEYKELLDLLIQLRTPKLSKDFKPSVINEILSDSLQPLSDDDLRPMAEAIENMDELSRKLKDKESAISAAEKISRVYDKYNKLILHKKAVAFFDVQESISNIQTKIAKNEGDMNEKKALIAKGEIELSEMNAKNVAMEKERETLGKSNAAMLKRREIELDGEVSRIETVAKEKERMLELKEQRRVDSEYKIKKEQEEKYSQNKYIRILLEEMETEADFMAFDEHGFFQDELLRQQEEPYEYETHKKQFLGTKRKIEGTFDILCELKQLKTENDEFLEKRDKLVRQLDTAQRKQTEAENLLTQMEGEWKEKLFSWEGENKELKIEKSRLGIISHFAEDYNESSDFSLVRQLVADIKQEYRSDIQSRLFEKNNEINVTVESIAKTRKELEEWENKKELTPERSDAVLRNRERLEKKGIPYQEFYKTIEFGNFLDEDSCNRLEEALLKMGILDALVIEEQYRDAVLQFEEGCEDRYLFAGTPPKGKSLMDILQLNDEVNDIFYNQRLTSILSCISYDVNESNAEGGGIAVYSDGRYINGILFGTITGQHKASFLGTKAREYARQEKIKQCQMEIVELEIIRDELQKECNVLKDRLNVLEKEYQEFPNDEDLKVALREVQIAEKKCSELLSDKKQLDEKIMLVKNLMREKQESAYEIGKTLHIELNYDAFKKAKSAAESYDKLLIQLIAEHRTYLKIAESVNNLNIQLEEIDDDIYNIREEHTDAMRNLLQKNEELSSVKKQLELTDYQEIKERLDKCTEWISNYPQRLSEVTERITVYRQECKSLSEEIEQSNVQLETEYLMSERLKRCYRKELELGYVDIPDELLKDSTPKVIINYLKAYISEQSWESINQKLNEIYYQQREFLNDYQPNFKSDLFAEEDEGISEKEMAAKRNDILARYQGNEIPFIKLLDYLREEIQELKELIKVGDRELFEDILANTVSRKIRSKINSASSWVNNMNTLMSSMNTSSGLKLSLKWRSKTAEAEEQLDTGELVQLLKKDYLSMTEDESTRLSAHFRSKVEEARRNSSDKSGLVSFYQVMKDTLDYRKWFEFQLFAQKTGERQKELTNSIFGTYSGGEKAMSMYVPLFSAVVAKYEGGSKMAPRLISLDEAFAGVDSRNIRDMFRLMSEFEFDFIINSQVLWGDSDTLDALAIYQLQRPENAKFVTVMTYLWNGNYRESIETERDLEKRKLELS